MVFSKILIASQKIPSRFKKKTSFLVFQKFRTSLPSTIWLRRPAGLRGPAEASWSALQAVDGALFF